MPCLKYLESEWTHYGTPCRGGGFSALQSLGTLGRRPGRLPKSGPAILFCKVTITVESLPSKMGTSDATCLCGLPTYRVKSSLFSGRTKPNSSKLTRAGCLSSCNLATGTNKSRQKTSPVLSVCLCKACSDSTIIVTSFFCLLDVSAWYLSQSMLFRHNINMITSKFLLCNVMSWRSPLRPDDTADIFLNIFYGCLVHNP